MQPPVPMHERSLLPLVRAEAYQALQGGKLDHASPTVIYPSPRLEPNGRSHAVGKLVPGNGSRNKATGGDSINRHLREKPKVVRNRASGRPDAANRGAPSGPLGICGALLGSHRGATRLVWSRLPRDGFPGPRQMTAGKDHETLRLGLVRSKTRNAVHRFAGLDLA